MRQVPDWIDGFTTYTENTEPPYLFRLWTAVSVVASALQRKCKLPWGSLTFYPNMYIVLVAPSGKARKGTAMSPGLEFLNDLGINLAAESITREALIQELKKISTNIIHPDSGSIEWHSSLTIFSPELVVFLGHNNFQLMSDLTDWYDCRKRWVYRTKHQGTDEIVGVWVNLIGATTPDLIQTALPMDAIGGGLTSRIIFVYEARKGKIVPAPFLTREEMMLKEKLRQDLERINLLQGEFKYTKEFVERWTDWYVTQDAHPPFDDPRLAGYCERRPNHVMKLAMILSASRTDEMVVTKADLDRSIKIIEATEQKMPNVFSGVGKSNVADITSKVLQTIIEEGKMPFSKILARFYYDADKFIMTKILDSLESMKYLKKHVEGQQVQYEATPLAKRGGKSDGQ